MDETMPQPPDRDTQIQERAKVPHGMMQFWFGQGTATNKDALTDGKKGLKYIMA